MLKLASKFAMDIFPSVIATILGAYIVNHYINNKTPAADTAAAVSTADPKKAAAKADSKPAERSADLGNMPEHGVRAKGISEKSISDKAATDKAAVEKPAEKADKPAEKADKPAETASIPPTTPAEPRHRPVPREKAASKPAPAAEPVVAAPAIAPATEPAATPDANDLARAAIERLRGTEPRAQESARVAPKAPEPKPAELAPVVASPAPVATSPSLQPLPPPILVSTPQVDNKPSAARPSDPLHPTPPAEIPDPGPGAAGAPLDLRADATAQPTKRPSVADDVLSATKKLFNSVIPK